jgi:xylan 1,4-beta-xylosidase
MIRKASFALILMLLSCPLFAQKKPLTYCNPINLDYGYTPIPNFSEQGRHRATADPVIVNFKGDYYLFSTNQWGYWWSSDLSNWKFVCTVRLDPGGYHAGFWLYVCQEFSNLDEHKSKGK